MGEREQNKREAGNFPTENEKKRAENEAKEVSCNKLNRMENRYANKTLNSIQTEIEDNDRLPCF